MKIIRFLFIVKENPPPTTGDGLYTQHRLKKSFEHLNGRGKTALHVGDACDLEGAILAFASVIKVTSVCNDITLSKDRDSIHLHAFHEEGSDTVSFDGAWPFVGVGNYALVEFGFKGGWL